MSDKQPQQAMPSGEREGAADGVNDAATNRSAGGESGGGGYANPHSGEEGGGQGFMGHGGQTKVAYHGTGQGGTDDDPDVGNDNAVTRQE